MGHESEPEKSKIWSKLKVPLSPYPTPSNRDSIALGISEVGRGLTRFTRSVVGQTRGGSRHKKMRPVHLAPALTDPLGQEP